MTQLKDWAKSNSGLLLFLAAQLIAIGAAVLSMTAYMTRLEGRVVTLEQRGSPHLGVIDVRLTTLESKTEENKQRLEKIVDVMTRKLNINP